MACLQTTAAQVFASQACNRYFLSQTLMTQVLLLLQAAHLEQALLLLPFAAAQKLLEYLCIPLEQGTHVELCCRVCTLLMRLHHQQLMATPQARPLMIKLQKRLREGIQVGIHTRSCLSILLCTSVSSCKHCLPEGCGHVQAAPPETGLVQDTY